MYVGDWVCGGGGDGRGSASVGWPGSACETGCDGGVDDCTKHAGATASVTTNGFENLRRGVRADMSRR
jgi:hypothetical protein